MRFVSLVSAALCFLLWTSVAARGQAGRYIPVPRIPSGGGVPHFLPHLPFFHGDGDGFWVVVAIVVVIVLAVVGWNLGQALGRAKSPARPGPSPSLSLPSIPPLEDLIIQPDEVGEKARKTTRLLDVLAKRDAAFNPCAAAGIHYRDVYPHPAVLGGA